MDRACACDALANSTEATPPLLPCNIGALAGLGGSQRLTLVAGETGATEHVLHRLRPGRRHDPAAEVDALLQQVEQEIVAALAGWGGRHAVAEQPHNQAGEEGL